ncbi:hypothetical protein PMALA_045600 [Plasmodium malariae]|uniref:Cleavage and polyadenylation specificity factor subunit 2 n=1 Tax=Plasmodium malariae TaxID=5858 RepID=A0A1A8WPZ9_PLAMA|nr:hypothetical protein PMALA_045600 [Plasmodium malariae]
MILEIVPLYSHTFFSTLLIIKDIKYSSKKCKLTDLLQKDNGELSQEDDKGLSVYKNDKINFNKYKKLYNYDYLNNKSEFYENEKDGNIYILINCGWDDKFCINDIKNVLRVCAYVDFILVTNHSLKYVGCLPLIYMELIKRKNNSRVPIICHEYIKAFSKYVMLSYFKCTKNCQYFKNINENEYLKIINELYEHITTIEYREYYIFKKIICKKKNIVFIVPLYFINNGDNIGSSAIIIKLFNYKILYSINFNVIDYSFIERTGAIKESDVFTYISNFHYTNKNYSKLMDIKKILYTVNRTINNLGCVIFPVDIDGIFIDLLFHVNALLEVCSQRYALLFLCPYSENFTRLLFTSLTYMNEYIKSNFHKNRINLFKIKNLICLRNYNDFKKFENAYYILFSFPASFNNDSAKKILSTFLTKKKNIVIFTKKSNVDSLSTNLCNYFYSNRGKDNRGNFNFSFFQNVKMDDKKLYEIYLNEKSNIEKGMENDMIEKEKRKKDCKNNKNKKFDKNNNIKNISKFGELNLKDESNTKKEERRRRFSSPTFDHPNYLFLKRENYKQENYYDYSDERGKKENMIRSDNSHVKGSEDNKIVEEDAVKDETKNGWSNNEQWEFEEGVTGYMESDHVDDVAKEHRDEDEGENDEDDEDEDEDESDNDEDEDEDDDNEDEDDDNEDEDDEDDDNEDENDEDEDEDDEDEDEDDNYDGEGRASFSRSGKHEFHSACKKLQRKHNISSSVKYKCSDEFYGYEESNANDKDHQAIKKKRGNEKKNSRKLNVENEYNNYGDDNNYGTDDSSEYFAHDEVANLEGGNKDDELISKRERRYNNELAKNFNDILENGDEGECQKEQGVHTSYYAHIRKFAKSENNNNEEKKNQRKKKKVRIKLEHSDKDNNSYYTGDEALPHKEYYINDISYRAKNNSNDSNSNRNRNSINPHLLIKYEEQEKEEEEEEVHHDYDKVGGRNIFYSMGGEKYDILKNGVKIESKNFTSKTILYNGEKGDLKEATMRQCYESNGKNKRGMSSGSDCSFKEGNKNVLTSKKKIWKQKLIDYLKEVPTNIQEQHISVSLNCGISSFNMENYVNQNTLKTILLLMKPKHFVLLPTCNSFFSFNFEMLLHSCIQPNDEIKFYTFYSPNFYEQVSQNHVFVQRYFYRSSICIDSVSIPLNSTYENVYVRSIYNLLNMASNTQGSFRVFKIVASVTNMENTDGEKRKHNDKINGKRRKRFLNEHSAFWNECNDAKYTLSLRYKKNNEEGDDIEEIDNNKKENVQEKVKEENASNGVSEKNIQKEKNDKNNEKNDDNNEKNNNEERYNNEKKNYNEKKNNNEINNNNDEKINNEKKFINYYMNDEIYNGQGETDEELLMDDLSDSILSSHTDDENNISHEVAMSKENTLHGNIYIGNVNMQSLCTTINNAFHGCLTFMNDNEIIVDGKTYIKKEELEIQEDDRRGQLKEKHRIVKDQADGLRKKQNTIWTIESSLDPSFYFLRNILKNMYNNISI